MSEEAPREPISIYEHLIFLAEQFAGLSWQKLGLQPDMVTGTLAPDLDEARVAIDVTAYVASMVEPRLDGEDKRRMQTLVKDLRLNYVQKRSEAGP